MLTADLMDLGVYFEDWIRLAKKNGVACRAKRDVRKQLKRLGLSEG